MREEGHLGDLRDLLAAGEAKAVGIVVGVEGVESQGRLVTAGVQQGLVAGKCRREVEGGSAMEEDCFSGWPFDGVTVHSACIVPFYSFRLH